MLAAPSRANEGFIRHEQDGRSRQDNASLPQMTLCRDRNRSGHSGRPRRFQTSRSFRCKLSASRCMLSRARGCTLLPAQFRSARTVLTVTINCAGQRNALRSLPVIAIVSALYDPRLSPSPVSRLRSRSYLPLPIVWDRRRPYALWRMRSLPTDRLSRCALPIEGGKYPQQSHDLSSFRPGVRCECVAWRGAGSCGSISISAA